MGLRDVLVIFAVIVLTLILFHVVGIIHLGGL